MIEELTMTNERVDDIPLLLAQLESMDVPLLLDKYFPTHGNWQGLSLGNVTALWLTFILSEANHRLSHAEPWAAKRLTTLQACLGEDVRALDLSDDRLAVVLDQLSDDEKWEEFERALNKHTLRVYDLQPRRARIDSTTAKGYFQVSEDGLFQLGHSKDHRPDLPQVKINISVLDPLGLPLTTTVVAGSKADDPLYLPEIKRVQQTLGRRGVTYIGDSKMSSLKTRAYVAASHDYYLCPLTAVQVSHEEVTDLLEGVWSGQQSLVDVYRPREAEEKKEKIAEGYEYTVGVSAQVDTQRREWRERRLVVRSVKLAESQEKSLQTRLAKVLEVIAALHEPRQGKKRLTEETDLRAAVEQVLVKYRVSDLVELSYKTQTSERRIRGYADRPARGKVEQTVTVTARVDQTALAKAVRSLGWRVYATNHSRAQLSLEQAVLAYREEYLVERGIGRLKGQPLSLTPMYLQTDERVTALIRLLMIGLRVLTLLEFRVRRQLQRESGTLSGIYAGNPKRATAHPTSEMMLRAFEGLTLTVIEQVDQVWTQLTSLTKVQQQILALLGFKPDIYLRLVQHFSKPVLNLSEP